MKIPLNFELMHNPINWVMIWVMAAMGYAGLMLIVSSAGLQDNTNNN